jgi:LDH2 family malate/lactate/ureidoglycolate dehydrogenase
MPIVGGTYLFSEPSVGNQSDCSGNTAGKYPAFVADFATTPIARGKLAIASKKGEKVPLGYVQDAFGFPSDDPDILKQGGAMLPLGGDRIHGSHKGYCLGALVDIFSSLLSGANFGPFVPPSIAYLPLPENQPGLGTGHFFGAMRIDAFRPAEEFKAMMDFWIETFKNAKPAEGQERVYIRVKLNGKQKKEPPAKVSPSFRQWLTK